MDYVGMATRERMGYDNRPQIDIVKTQELGVCAAMAVGFLDKWGMVAIIPEGEDSAGRATSRLSTPEEAVSRAVAIAELALAEFEKRGWLLVIPIPAEPKDGKE